MPKQAVRTSAHERNTACIFCEVVAGTRPAHIVWQDGSTLAFLDHRPLFPGHCLLIPRAHHFTLTDLPLALVGPLFTNARRLARAVELALRAEGTFVALNNRVSQSIPHVHVHVVPRRRGDGLRGFFWPRTRYGAPEEMDRVRDLIRQHLAAQDET